MTYQEKIDIMFNAFFNIGKNFVSSINKKKCSIFRRKPSENPNINHHTHQQPSLPGSHSLMPTH
jgi:hypothetical protein